jgi:hypothetical protein
MRVSDGGTVRSREMPRRQGERRFGDALRRAASAELTRACATGGPRAGPLRRVRGETVAVPRRWSSGEERPPAGPVAGPLPPRIGEPAARSELREALRGLPAAIEAARTREGARLALSFGRSLKIEIRATPAGVDLVLRPEPRLSHACAAELGGLLAALRTRGIAIARVAIRARQAGVARASPRVDGATPLR